MKQRTRTHTTVSIRVDILTEAKRRGYCISKILEDALLERMQKENQAVKQLRGHSIDPNEYISYLIRKGYTEERIRECFKRDYPDIDPNIYLKHLNIPKSEEKKTSIDKLNEIIINARKEEDKNG